MATSGPPPASGAGEQVLHTAHRLAAALNRCSDGISVHAADGRLVHANDALCEILGCGPNELLQLRPQDLIYALDLEATLERFQSAFSARGSSETIRYRVRRNGEELRTVESVVSDLLDEPDVGAFLIATRDITEQLHNELRLQQLTLTDCVTGLANRAAFELSLLNSLADSDCAALLYIEVDGLDWIIDANGYTVTDEALKILGARVRSTTRDAPIAHLGNGCYVVLASGPDCRSVLMFAEAIQRALNRPLHLNGQVLYPTASIGITSAEGRDCRPAQLLKEAAATAHDAKERGGARVQVFDETIAGRMERRLAIAHQLQHAVGNAEFEIYYQPIVELQTRQPHAAEALLRWSRAKGDDYPTDEFISVAERTGLIVPLGQFALDRALADRARLVPASDLVVNVNLSVRQLAERTLVDTIDASINEAGICPAQVAFEVTETLALQDFDLANRVINDIRDLGCQVGIDDFGTGFSALGYLHKLSVDFIKIDRSFVQSLGGTTPSDSLVAAIIALGDALRLRVVAEGIETEDQLERLRRLGCRYGQGYLFASPAPDLEHVVAAAARQALPRDVAPHHVAPGVVLAQDLVDTRGRLLARSGQLITERMLELIHRLAREDRLAGPIAIRAPATDTADHPDAT